MMNFLIALLTLTGGALIGSAIMHLKKQEMSPSLASVMWTGLVVLFLVGGALSIKGGELVHPHSLLPILSWIMALIIYCYGVFFGIAFSLRNTIKKESQDAEKNGWLPAICSNMLAKLPLIFWVLIIAVGEGLPQTSFPITMDINPYSGLFISIIVTLVAVSTLWLLIKFALLLIFLERNKNLA